MQNSHHQLSTWQLVMLALGTVVGGSFFLGTAITLRTAGTATLLAFTLGGLVVFLILRALSEMTVSRPAHGSFRAFAGSAFGPMASYVVGWLYWSGLVLALSSEAMATALFARLWVPAAPAWLLGVLVILGVTLLNLIDVRAFATIESAMAAVKLGVLALFILLVGSVVLGLYPGRAPLAPVAQPFMPTGLGGFGGSMLTVLFTYAGFEVMGLAAPDARDPQRTVPRAVMWTVFSLLVLYIGAMAVILPVLPTRGLEAEVSPMVLTLEHLGFGALGPLLNFAVMTAALSTILAAMYGLSRMLYSLANEGQGPAVFKRLTPAGLPRNAILASSVGMLAGIGLGNLLPRQVYLFLVSSAGFALLFSYLMILASQLVLRRRAGCREGLCQMPFYPYSSYLGILVLLTAIITMPFVPGQGAGLVAGLSLLAVIAFSYLLVKPQEPEAEPTDDRVPLR